VRTRPPVEHPLRRRVSVELDSDLRRALRLAAADRDEAMSQLVLEAIRQHPAVRARLEG
jgi:uncharacterized protein (DUF1778 family)